MANGEIDDDIPTDPHTIASYIKYFGCWENYLEYCRAWKNLKKLIKLKQEMAMELMREMEDDMSASDYRMLITMIDNTFDIDDMNIITRMVRKAYCTGCKINRQIIEKQIEDETIIDEL